MSSFVDRGSLASGMCARILGAVLLTAVSASCTSAPPAYGADADQLPTSWSWSAWLEGPDGEVPFILDLVHEDDRIRAWIVLNGSKLLGNTLSTNPD